MELVEEFRIKKSLSYNCYQSYVKPNVLKVSNKMT
jgi:hypothetical protein